MTQRPSPMLGVKDGRMKAWRGPALGFVPSFGEWPLTSCSSQSVSQVSYFTVPPALTPPPALLAPFRDLLPWVKVFDVEIS